MSEIKEIRDGTSFTNSHWTNLSGTKQIITVDFDHTITRKCLACKDGLKNDGIQKGVVEALQELHKDYQIWIFTGACEMLDLNPPVGRTVEDIENFLKAHNIPFDKILQIKPPSCFLIDDRAIHHKSWKQTMEEIRRREKL